MAACDSFQHIFEKPLPENPTLIEALSQWNRHQMRKAKKSIDLSSFSEIFGELHFHEKNHHNPNPLDSSSSSSSSSPHSPFSLQPLLIEDDKDDTIDDKEKDNNNDNPSSSSSSTWSSSSSSSSDAGNHHHHHHHFSSKSSESLQLCTEGLGSESADDVEDSTPNISNKEGFASDDCNTNEEEEEEEEEEEMMDRSSLTKHSLYSLSDRHYLPRESYSSSRSTTAFTSFGSGSGGSCFPPPISCIGRSGKPWICFRSYRRDGRFVLKEIRIPTHEFLHACRADGRLRLRFVQPDEENPKEEEDEEEDNVVDVDEDEEEEEEEEEVGGSKN